MKEIVLVTVVVISLFLIFYSRKVLLNAFERKAISKSTKNWLDVLAIFLPFLSIYILMNYNKPVQH